jgi:hypothetical protein
VLGEDGANTNELEHRNIEIAQPEISGLNWLKTVMKPSVIFETTKGP